MEKKEKVDFVLRIAQKFVNADPETKQFVAGYLTRAEEEKKEQQKKEMPVAYDVKKIWFVYRRFS